MQKNELRESIRKAPDVRISEILNRKSDYSPEAVLYAEEEASLRKIDPKAPTEHKEPSLQFIKIKKFSFRKVKYHNTLSGPDVIDQPDQEITLPGYLRFFAGFMLFIYAYRYWGLIEFFVLGVLNLNINVIVFNVVALLLTVLPFSIYILLAMGYRIGWYGLLLHTCANLFSFFFQFGVLRFLDFENPGYDEIEFVLRFVIVILPLYILHKKVILLAFEITPKLRYRSYFLCMLFGYSLYWFNQFYNLTF